jgi:hypothetical protein
LSYSLSTARLPWCWPRLRNKQRVKTNEQIGREYDALEAVEKARAKQRQAEQAKVNQPQAKKSQNREAVPTSDAGRARDTVGQKIGVSGLTAQRAAYCVRMMDALDWTCWIE